MSLNVEWDITAHFISDLSSALLLHTLESKLSSRNKPNHSPKFFSMLKSWGTFGSFFGVDGTKIKICTLLDYPTFTGWKF